MKTEGQTKIYILGAGCSASNGYPVAKNFVAELEVFENTLSEQAARIKKCVQNTIALMRPDNITTIDDLTARIHAGRFDRNSSHGSVADNQARDQRVREAKIATAAMFLSKEKAAKQTGLHNYHKLILKIFPDGLKWDERFKRTNWHVLTFNYDRLFELALLDRIEPHFSKVGLYSSGLLNSGLNPFTPDLRFDDKRFSFLKLHGSIGALVKHEPLGFTYHPFDDEGFAVDSITDARFFPVTSKPDTVGPWPLLIFPFEKHHVQSGGQHLYYEKYIKGVWKKAEKLIANATEIRVVGYQFHELDRHSLIRLLISARNCKRGIIQNLPGEAERICTMLKMEHPEIQIPWEPYPSEF